MESFSDLLLAFAPREDSIFYFVLMLSAAASAGAELVWWVRRRRVRHAPVALSKAVLPLDDPRFKPLWTLVPVLVLILLGFVSQKRPKSVASELKQHRYFSNASLESMKSREAIPRLMRSSRHGD